MSEQQGPQDKNLSFDQIELHSDINVHQSKPTEPPRRHKPAKHAEPKKGSSSALVAVLLCLFLASAGAAGYFYMRFDETNKRLEGVAKEAADAAANLQATQGEIENMRQNLSSKEGSITEARTNVSKLNDNLQDIRNENSSLKKRLSGLENDLAARTKDLESTKSNLSKAQKDLDSEKQNTSSLRKQRDSLRDEMALQKKDFDQRIQEKETALAEAVEKSRLTEEKAKQDVQSIRRQLRDLQTERDRVAQSAKEESEASAKIIGEVATLKRDNADMNRELTELRRKMRDANEKIKRLENVSFGDLVPYDLNIEGGDARYREPLPEGIKIPRKVGKVMLQVLINEVGAVEQAVIVPGQEIEAELAAGVTRTIYKWKFTPPTLDGTRVKAWMPVLITP